MPTKGQVKIGAKDAKHVFIDAENEEDYKFIASYNYVQLSEDHSMKIQRWIPNFKSNKNTSLALVWINLPDLPWHYYEWASLCRIVGPIGTAIVMDKATQTKTRPTTAKMRIEIDLLKPLITDVQVTIQNPEGIVETFNQKIEYETVPLFCSHCRIQGHIIEGCQKAPKTAQVDDQPKERNDEGMSDQQRASHNNNQSNKGNVNIPMMATDSMVNTI
ncbi:uncharacterized protein [Nicotiana sylvestris]|uniref:DUF4283 domain-containing protein n=2 Tax=Nicotiana TaxID=4085 RepID=A0A1S4ASI1_TOBAC|nr:PREDICTED: uncharacterized protein LOC104218041 [Nicotiana sylvestris]XP_016479551.1 PREDICTED: uncharacterized protein LOC107800821 [Nicotiana tabacum]